MSTRSDSSHKTCSLRVSAHKFLLNSHAFGDAKLSSELYDITYIRLDDTTCCDWNFSLLIKSKQSRRVFDVTSYQQQPKISWKFCVLWLSVGPEVLVNTFCLISGFRRGENEVSFFWNFTQRTVVVAYRRFGTIYLSYLQGTSSRRGMFDPWRRDQCCPETSVRNYHSTLRNIRKEHIFWINSASDI
jgi:hypothetical protein